MMADLYDRPWQAAAETVALGLAIALTYYVWRVWTRRREPALVRSAAALARDYPHGDGYGIGV